MKALQFVGRVKPYSAAEIGRFKCLCGKRAGFQWSSCANNHRSIPVCEDCDIALNEMVLSFFRVPDRVRIIAAYRRRVIRAR